MKKYKDLTVQKIAFLECRFDCDWGIYGGTENFAETQSLSHPSKHKYYPKNVFLTVRDNHFKPTFILV